MKFLLIATALLTFGMNTQASEDKEVFCKALLQEEGERVVYDFVFKCDNYGQDATFFSKTKRYMIQAFSEESCVAALFIHDNKTNTLSLSAADQDRGNEKGSSGFAVFENNLVTASIVSDIKREDLMGNMDNIKNKSVVGCSTNKELLKDIQ